jgi:hypothetical protein
VNTGATTSCDGTYGYQTSIDYTVQDNLLDTLPAQVGVNEAWTTDIVPDYMGTNWRRIDAFGFNMPDSTFADNIQGEASGFVPAASCTGDAVAVQHWGQEWRVGSTTSGSGRRVQTNTLQKYTQHAEHTNPTSPAP